MTASPSHPGLPKKYESIRCPDRWHTSQGQHSLHVVGQHPQALADRAVAVTAQQIHDSRPQEREHRCIGAIGVAVGVLSKLGVTGPVPFVFVAARLLRSSCSSAGGSDAAGRLAWCGCSFGTKDVLLWCCRCAWWW